MAVRTIVTGADSTVLRAHAAPVRSFGKNLMSLITDLLDTVRHAEGAGLAAPQIGDSSQVTVARIGGKFVPLINPEIIWRSGDVYTAEEGCLSLPDVWCSVPRDLGIIIRFQNTSGRMEERKLTHWDARVVQHELDHLRGTLIVDYGSKTVDAPGEAL